jgi:hypothetical protein
MKSLKMTPAERVAVAICKMLSDLHLDIEALGAYIYRVFPPLMYNRFVEIAEAAAHEKKMMTDPEYAREFHKLGL